MRSSGYVLRFELPLLWFLRFIGSCARFLLANRPLLTDTTKQLLEQELGLHLEARHEHEHGTRRGVVVEGRGHFWCSDVAIAVD